MRRTTWVALAAALSLVLVSVPASADFHGDCTGFATAYANTELFVVEEEPGERFFAYHGVVNCPGAAITIEHLEVAPAGAEDPLNVADERECQANLDPCVATGSVPAPEPGLYRVNMTFDAGGFEGVERLQRWQWLGAGQPVPVCANVGAVPFQAGMCPSG